uniref:Uncharacterized protein n=1 Tax=Vitrella brassicaformis TaxID=1169539 RepID=A0A7S1PAF5_9ALVE
MGGMALVVSAEMAGVDVGAAVLVDQLSDDVQLVSGGIDIVVVLIDVLGKGVVVTGGVVLGSLVVVVVFVLVVLLLVVGDVLVVLVVVVGLGVVDGMTVVTTGAGVVETLNGREGPA